MSAGALRKVIVARLDNLGDVLLSGPAVRAVARAAKVTYVCSPRSRGAAELLPGVSDIIEFRAEWIEADPQPVTAPPIERFLAAVARSGATQAIVLTSFHQSPLPLALLLRLAGVGRIAAISEDYPGSLLDVRHRVSDDLHEVQRALSLVEAAGYPLAPSDRACLQIRRPGRAPAPLPDRYVAVHLSASVPARTWSLDNVEAAVCALMTAGYDVVLTGGPEDVLAARRICRSTPRPSPVNLAGQTDLPALAAVLARAVALVSGNTGPAHLAAAVGTPVVSIYAPTVPADRWRPWMVPHVLLGRQDIACAGCRARLCPVPGHPCIDNVPPGEVVTAVESLVGVPPSPEQQEPDHRLVAP
jgi:ADP-heptose:LPS heptosyltransferase